MTEARSSLTALDEARENVARRRCVAKLQECAREFAVVLQLATDLGDVGEIAAAAAHLSVCADELAGAVETWRRQVRAF